MNLPNRKNLRLQHFDYRSNVAYFVTICVGGRHEIFGAIRDDQMHLSQRGKIARDSWLDLPNHHDFVELDHFVVMPNHIHGILRFVGATPASPIRTLPAKSLSATIGSFKSAVSRKVNLARPGAADEMWQRSFHDHVIRNDREFELIWQYIDDNPLRWHEDECNSIAARPRKFAAWLTTLEPEAGDAGVAPTL